MGKASIEEQTDRPTLMEKQKGLFAAIMPLQLMEITLNCFRIHICIMTTLYTLGFKTAEQGRFGYNEVPVLYGPAAATELHKTQVGMLRVRLRSRQIL